jgi:phage terminase large subunit-like protein
MRRISRAYFSQAREVVAVLPRGCWKTSLAAAICLHHLITTKGAAVVIGAASVQQARVRFERMEGYVRSADLDVTVRHLELRFEGSEGIRCLRVVPSDGPRTHGLSCTLYVADEVWAWSERADRQHGTREGLTRAQAERELRRRMEREDTIAATTARLTVEDGGLIDHLEARPQEVHD